MFKFIVKTVFSFTLIVAVAHSQTNAEQVLQKMQQKFDQVKNYQVDVKVKIDVDFLKVPESEATIYFKAPDKIAMKTGDKFALMPKEGLNFNPGSLLKGKYSGVMEKDAKINGRMNYTVKVIPTGSNSDVVLSTFWIDKETYYISRIETTTKTNGSFTLDLTYPSKSVYPLPSSMVFSFEVGMFNMPKAFGGGKGKEKGKGSGNPGAKTPGKVYITYKNYKVNKGVPDSVFKK
ncbi:MAG: hypothetical protein LC102_00295 [Ignavibacteriales bacterium]|nr:MAG: hypothetical protein F9K26_03980 [Ignavibacteriaceae bacterium]MBW7872595.1 hypothetical protein [Ignavibacteria bacterium]MCZ2141852.1 hypothetical protein [Ignavibacteriales bacterium]OQY70960.1 MAG: hypothetical protein B6D45_10690 [Ignavibacteriales bacterium UTCHB3]MBV6445019.1 hypothetical protein [Ignavibacteriaceae bacterium]